MLVNEIDIYNRQRGINFKKINARSFIIGCGGTGFWTALFLAMSGVKKLFLVDNDVIEETNLNRLPYKKEDLGRKKTEALRDYIKEVRPVCSVHIIDMKIETESECMVIPYQSVIFCCTDSLRSQQLLRKYANLSSCSYQRVGYDGLVLNVSNSMPLTFKNPDDLQGYTETPSWVIPAAMAAALGVYSQIYNKVVCMKEIGEVRWDDNYIDENSKSLIMKKVKDNPACAACSYIPDAYWTLRGMRGPTI